MILSSIETALAIGLLLAPAAAPAQTITFSRAVANIEYLTDRLAPKPPPGVTGMPAITGSPWYGRILRRLPEDLPTLATTHFIPFVVEYREGRPARAWVDRDRDGDLAGEQPLELAGYPGEPDARSFLVDVAGGGTAERLTRVVLEPLAAAAPASSGGGPAPGPRYRMQMVHAMVGTVSLEGKPHHAFLHDGNGDGSYTRDVADGLFVDRDDDGRVVVDQMSDEFGSFSVPFTMGSHRYEVAEVDVEGRRITLRDLGPAAPRPEPPVVGRPAPAFSITDTDGRARRLSDYKGRCTLVYFWSSTCWTCKGQADDLLRLYERHHPRGLEILGISYDSDRGAMEAFRRQHHQTWPTSFSGRQLWEDPVGRIYRERGSGVLYLVDPRGILQGTYSRIEDLSQAIDQLM